MKSSERRVQRSCNTTRALALQLERCREDAALDGLVLSDTDGVCLATSGDEEACLEVAARLPFIGRKQPVFEGVLLGADNGWRIRMRRLDVAGAELYLCAIGDSAQHAPSMTRSATGVTRILQRAGA